MPSMFAAIAEGHHSGFLVKLARYSKRNWKTRFFTLSASPPVLCYYKKKGDSKEAGKIIVDATTTTEVADARPNCFRISNSSYGDLYVQAPTKAEMETWMQKITYVANVSKQTKRARRKLFAPGSTVQSPLGASAGSPSSWSAASSPTNLARQQSQKKARNAKVLRSIEGFLADRAHCRKFYESAEVLILPGKKDVEKGELVPKKDGAIDVEQLFPAKTKKSGPSDELKQLLQGADIQNLSIPSVTLSETARRRSSNGDTSAADTNEGRIFKVCIGVFV